jgi:hypothetical protein
LYAILKVLGISSIYYVPVPRGWVGVAVSLPPNDGDAEKPHWRAQEAIGEF